MKGYSFYLSGSLEKVFPCKKPAAMQDGETLYIMKGEIPAVQLVYRREPGTEPKKFQCLVKGFPEKIRLRDVELVPSAFPCFDQTDDNYLTTEPGLFPDLLVPKEAEVEAQEKLSGTPAAETQEKMAGTPAAKAQENLSGECAVPVTRFVLSPLANQYRAVWIDFPETKNIAAGTYQIEMEITEYNPDAAGVARTAEAKIAEKITLQFAIAVSDAVLPEQTLIHTEWFHTDCIADYYHTEVFSEKHWNAVEKQIAMAADLGINMLLTPVFTPPLDTAVGGERTTVQLVDIAYLGGKWSFDFEKLEKWCSLCHKHGIKYLEIAHLFTQWGAHATPKIIVTTENGPEKMFGWHVAATDPAYREFLENFLPALQEKLVECGFGKEQVIFHISDEPGTQVMESYQAARAAAKDLLEGWKIFDALSEYEFYEEGIVEHPIPSNDHIQKFVDHGVKDLWTYYCCGQTVDVPNRFFAMPSARNRIMGVLMYLYDIKGFLQWGFNFYNASLSRFHLDPYFDTHANYAFPSGDAFLVYPGPDGTPYSSIRGEVQRQGLADMRALQYLESRIGRPAVEELIYADRPEAPFTFKNYPKDAAYFDQLRRRIAEKM